MSLFNSIKEGIALAKEAKSVEAAQIHSAYIQNKLEDLEKEMSDLKLRNSQLISENESLKKQIASLKKESEYLDIGVCLLKQNPAGGYFDTPLCPSCKKPLSSFGLEMICGTCFISQDALAISAAVRKSLASWKDTSPS